MKSFHFIMGKANKDKANGVNQVCAGLAKSLNGNGCELRMIGKTNSVSKEGETFVRDGFQVKAFSKMSRDFFVEIDNAIMWADIVHFHGLYNPWNIVVGIMCAIRKRKYIVTLHDGLAPARLRRRRFLKLIFNALFQRRFLRGASAIHALTEEESTDLLNMVNHERVFIVPNGIDLDDFPKRDAPIRSNEGKLRIGYLGRISPEKNIKSLLLAISQSFSGGEAEFLLAGPDSDYLRSLLDDIDDESISWVGPMYNTDKVDFLRSLDLFVHPTYCDVFSIAAMEVLALGVPLLITRTSNASYFFDKRAFFMCEPTVFGLTGGIKRAIANRQSWDERSRAGRRLIDETLNWDVAGKEIKKIYEELV